jgi:CheY-like chemotaxis protein
MPPARAVLVDDNESESRLLAELLSSDDLDVQVLLPGSSIDDTIESIQQALADGETPVVLLDYRLDDRTDDVRFRGGSVAGGLKDRHPEIPVVLFTTDEKLQQWVAKRPGMEELFDSRVLKGSITDETRRDAARAQIVDLGRGWYELHTADSSESTDLWDWLAAILRIDRTELEPLAALEADPPRVDAPSEVAAWIIGQLLHWPGPLYDENDARVMCGISVDSFESEPVQTWLAPVRYTGPFQGFGRRWWTEPLRERVAQVAEVPSDASSRAAGIADSLGVELEGEGCAWCGRGRTIRACMICRRATDAAHSVRPLADPAPAWADPPVVCFTCIAEGRAQSSGTRFAPTDADVVRGLEDGSIASSHELESRE